MRSDPIPPLATSSAIGHAQPCAQRAPRSGRAPPTIPPTHPSLPPQPYLNPVAGRRWTGAHPPP
eukprot:3410833-Prymnesium_polylepis.4